MISEKILAKAYPNHPFVVEGDFSLGKVKWLESKPDIELQLLEDMATDVEKEELSALVKAEVAKRIVAYASESTQMNMTGAATAGLLSDEQKEAYKQGLIWVGVMRAKGAELIAEDVLGFASDEHWPEPSAAAVALAKAF